ncbi:putative lipid kinase [[Eubacterium] yurii subsp. margaretiae ATCC 43715]|nr:putative lipid kinase [[Eubacterium] yurii subsp. margaretiae ATCC 43715]
MVGYKKALFIYNPKSGNREVASELSKIVNKFMKNNIILTVIRLDSAVYDKLSDLMLSLDYDFIIGSGGDGSISTIASNILRSNIQKPYAVIGSGTCNNFASNINMKPALYRAIEQISKQKTSNVDIGCLDSGQVFLSSLAVGIFAETSFETNSDLKEWLGPLAYYLQGITKLSNIKADRFVIKTESEIIEETAYMVLALNGNNVGSMTGILDNQVDLKDGLFEIIIVKEVQNPIDIANLLVQVARGEDFTKNSFIRVVKASTFEIDSDNRNLAVSLDGEKGPSLPLKVSVKREALNVIVG